MGTYKDLPPETSHERLSQIGKQHGLSIITDAESDNHRISFRKAERLQLDIIAELLDSELSVYDAEMLKTTRLQRIVICNQLSDDGHDIAGLAQMGLFIVDTIFIDTNRMTRNWDYARKTFHHELFHAIDYHDDFLHYIDTDWRHLNPIGFAYDREMFKGYNEPCDTPGFVSTYSQTAIHEDKAELYSHLILDHAKLTARCQHDEFLDRKVKHMKALLLRDCKHFDEAFWQKMDERSRQLHAHKFSLWEKSKHQWAKGGDGAAESNLSQNVKVWTMTEERKRTWRVATCLETGEPYGNERKFFTFNKLAQFLRELEVDEALLKEKFKEPVILRARVCDATLKKLGL